MRWTLDSVAALAGAPFDDVIDVRAPSEFAEDHLPGAISLPVLSDEERARVGTIYVREDRFKARRVGAALVARNAAAHIEERLADRDGSWRPLVYCWRGGQRSGSFAVILDQIGWRVGQLEGGYRSWRRLVSAALYDGEVPHRLVVLDGNTGTAKTDILKAVGRLGGQVLDLEGLARHRGSVLGAVAGGQPAQKGFETALASAMAGLDPARPTLVEAESSKIGERMVPPALWKAMRAAPRIAVEAEPEVRAAYLVRAYADLVADPGEIAARLRTLIPLRGRARVEAWCELADAGEHEALALALVEEHYDPRYARGAMRRDAAHRLAVRLEGPAEADVEAAARRVLAAL
jgi:tRNA 2-selenouridine synthase